MSLALFEPTQVGHLTLSHRIVMAPMTRLRADDKHVPLPTTSVYYSQRSTTPGTLLISEATYIAPKAGGHSNVPGIWSEDQICEWKKVTDAVHAQGSFIYMQLWALGRVALDDHLKAEDPTLDVVSASDVPMEGRITPRALTKAEIKEYVQLYATAASNAVNKAGFDGVEIHNANGYLLDQFLQINSNKRTDEYGGSAENRARFTFEVLKAVTDAVGANKTGIRFSPWSEFQGMRMPEDSIYETFTYIVTNLRDLYPNLAYLHLIESRVKGDSTTASSAHYYKSNDFLIDIWSTLPLIRAGQFDRQSAMDVADKAGHLVAFGRHYISNPDLPKRLKEGVPLTPYDRSVFYMPGESTGFGYTDYASAGAGSF